jgi:hypothetical protein
MPPLQNKLHERFSWLVAEGESHTEAYRKLMPHAGAPHVLGHKVYHRPEVKSRIAEIAEEVATRSVMTISRKREVLRQMVEGQFPTKVIRNKAGGIVAIFDRLAAMQMDAKLAGEFAPERHELVASNLKLTFKIQSRNTQPKEIIDAEIIENDNYSKPTLTETNPLEPEIDFKQFEDAPMSLDQEGLKDL